MRLTGATDLLFITVSQNVSFMGKTWWMLMLVLRLLLLLPAGVTLFGDEQERFVCNTIQPGCSNVCFDVFAPVSVLRLWLLHLLLLCLPHVLFATYVVHKLSLLYPHAGAFCRVGSRTGWPLAPENWSSSREASLRKAPRFYRAYVLAVILRILLEVVFGVAQFFLFGLSVPKSFRCHEAPCTSGVECFVSRPTEKTFMLSFMLGVASLSVLLSLADLLSSARAMARWRRKMLMEEMSKGERSSTTTTTTTVSEDGGVLSSRRVRPGGSSVDAVTPQTGLSEKSPDPKMDAPRSPTPISAAMPTHLVLHDHLGRPPSPRQDRGPPPTPRVPTPLVKLGQGPPPVTKPSRHMTSDNGDCQDKRAWV